MRKWLTWAIASLISFAILESYALVTRRLPTLSRTVWRLTKAYPIFAFALGTVVGGLAIHFFGWIPACAP